MSTTTVTITGKPGEISEFLDELRVALTAEGRASYGPITANGAATGEPDLILVLDPEEEPEAPDLGLLVDWETHA